MRSQVVTIMAPEDERDFLAFAFERPTAYLIPSVRNPTSEVPRTRELSGLASCTCMLWDEAILPRPGVDYVAARGDYVLRSNESLIQFLRSPMRDGTIQAGRIALATSLAGAPDTDPATARAMTTWYDSLRRWIRSHFKNSFVCASDYKPEVGHRERGVWVGPGAIERSRLGVKLKHNGPPEYSLIYFDSAEDAAVLARYREPRRLLAVGRVVGAGPSIDPSLGRRSFEVELESGAPFPRFVGSFACSRPEPKIGDEVACLFTENIFGRHAEPWEPGEIKTLRPGSHERPLASLRKAWRCGPKG